MSKKRAAATEALPLPLPAQEETGGMAAPAAAPAPLPSMTLSELVNSLQATDRGALLAGPSLCMPRPRP